MEACQPWRGVKQKKMNRSNRKAAHRAGFQHGERLFAALFTNMRNSRSLFRGFPEISNFLDFQRFQTLFRCPGGQAVLDCLHQVVQLFVDLSQLLFQQRDRGVLLILDIHDQLNDLVDHRFVLNQLHGLPDD